MKGNIAVGSGVGKVVDIEFMWLRVEEKWSCFLTLGWKAFDDQRD